MFLSLKDQKIALLERRVSSLEKENDLLRQQKSVQEKLTELAKREAEVYRTAFEKEKELIDRALRLSEVGKPKSNWELQGILGVAAFVLGFVAGTKSHYEKEKYKDSTTSRSAFPYFV